MGGKSGKVGADPGNCGEVIIARDKQISHTHFYAILCNFSAYSGYDAPFPRLPPECALLAERQPAQQCGAGGLAFRLLVEAAVRAGPFGVWGEEVARASLAWFVAQEVVAQEA